MKKINIKSIKLSPYTQRVWIFLVSFGMGYAASELVAYIQTLKIQQPSYQQAVSLKEGAASVCFTPNKQCQVQIIEQINKAKQSIYVQAYSFTDQEIAKALVKAVKRGVKVHVLLDKSNRNNKCSTKDTILQNKIPLRFDSPPGIAHNKVLIIDQHVVLSGSYNFSLSAYKRNTENLLILHSPILAAQYSQNWQRRWEISKER